MTAWPEGPLAGYDCETGGIDVENDPIVTTTLVTVMPGEAPVAHEWLIAPHVEIGAEATEVHGITTEYAREHGRPPAEVLGEVVPMMLEWWGRGLPIVIFNARFDITITDRELRRHRGEHLTDPRPIIDPFVIDKGADRYRKGTRKLDPTATHHRAPLVGGAHDATVDAIGACRLAWRLGRVFPKLAALDLDTLHNEQAKKAGEQQASYERYRCDQLAREGKWDEAMALHCPREWPLIPYREEASA